MLNNSENLLCLVGRCRDRMCKGTNTERKRCRKLLLHPVALFFVKLEGPKCITIGKFHNWIFHRLLGGVSSMALVRGGSYRTFLELAKYYK